MTSVCEPVVALWERLFQDESTKDVEIAARDGESIKVHSSLFMSLSDVFRAMLQAPMQESQTKQVNLNDFSKSELQFFFRLAYTGQVEPDEWPDHDATVSASSDSKGYSKPKGGSDEKGDGKGNDGRVRPLLSSKSGKGKDGKLDGKGYKDFVASQNGVGKGDKSKGKSGGGGFGDKVPLDLLFGSAAFCKQFVVRDFFGILIQRIAQRLRVSTFNQIAMFAIKHDVASLRMKCLRFAEDDSSRTIHDLFQSQLLAPEVIFELQVVWPTSAQDAFEESRKRQRFF